MASESASTSADAWKESTNPLDHCDVVSKKANTTDYLCKWCNRGFSGSKTRCYIHLTGDGKGVARCSMCPAETQRALKAARVKGGGISNNKRKAEEDEKARLEAQKKAEEERVAKVRAENCERARSYMRSLNDGIRIAKVNANGEREVLDDSARAAEQRRTQELITSECR